MDSKLSYICLVLCLACVLTVYGQASQEGSYSNIQEMIDSNLVFPRGNSLQQMFFGVGYQIYNYNGTSWGSAVNVSASLYDFTGGQIGYHYFLKEKDSNGGRPSWETFQPDSAVTVKTVFSVPQSDSIPWLLNQATRNKGSLDILGSTTFVQRLFTKGGNPPDLDHPAEPGDVYESPYSSLYLFASAASSLRKQG